MRPGRPPISVAATETNWRGRPAVSSLTRWVLAHKRIVVVAGSRSRMRASSRRGRRRTGSPTTRRSRTRRVGRHDRDRDRYHCDGSPLLPVVTLPAGITVDSLRVKAELAASMRGCARRCRARGSLRLRPPAAARSCPLTAHRLRARLRPATARCLRDLRGGRGFARAGQRKRSPSSGLDGARGRNARDASRPLAPDGRA